MQRYVPITHQSSEPTEAEKVVFLSRREIWPHVPDEVKVIETHMSWVFLVGARVYKLKKPVRTAFLDFSSIARREAAVDEELRLNRRLAPGVYLGRKAVRIDSEGSLTLGDAGRVVDWLVEMRRLPEDRTLQSLISAGLVTQSDLVPFIKALAVFYRNLAPADITPARFVSGFIREHRETRRVLTNPVLGFDGANITEALVRFEETYKSVRPLLEDRVRAGRVVEGHGDLRPEHVFLTEPTVVIDSLEFNRNLRTVDPFDELAYLCVECARLGADWVLPALRKQLEAALEDRPDPSLLAFYWRYRALLRARIALLHLAEPVLREPGKWRPLARDYLDLARQAEIRCAPQ